MLDGGPETGNSNVVSLAGAVPARRGGNERPLLVLVDVLREYIELGRPLRLDSIEKSLFRLARVLEHARQDRWLVAHVRWRQDYMLFNEHQCFSEFISGFRPLGNEMVFCKPAVSAYSSPDFVSMMNARCGADVYVAGYQGPSACLATLVDGHSRAHRLRFIADASSSPRIQDADEATAHEYLVNFARHYGDVVYSEDVISGTDVTGKTETSMV